MDNCMLIPAVVLAWILILAWYVKAEPTPEQSEMLLVTVGAVAILIIFLTLLFGW